MEEVEMVITMEDTLEIAALKRAEGADFAPHVKAIYAGIDRLQQSGNYQELRQVRRYASAAINNDR